MIERLTGLGLDGAGRLADATGLDRAVDRAAEEAIVRALESPAVERALRRVLDQPEGTGPVDRLLASQELERALLKVLDSEMIDRIWERLLAGDQVQRLIERIAEAPEIRQAIASQGVGLVADIGEQLREVTGRIDRGLERLGGRLRGRRAALAGPGPAMASTSRALPIGLMTRATAALVDAAILNGIFFAITTIIGITVAAVVDLDQHSGPLIAFGAGSWLIAAAVYLVTFWALVGQTPGMRFLSIRVLRPGAERLGWRCAVRRLIGVGLSVLAFGLPFLRLIFAADHQAFHDRFTRTEVADFDRRARWVRAGGSPNPAA